MLFFTSLWTWVASMIVDFLYECVRVCAFFMCVCVFIGCVQTHGSRLSSIQTMKSMNQKPQEFSQIHNNADHKYWEEDTPQKNYLESFVFMGEAFRMRRMIRLCIILILFLCFYMLTVSIVGHISLLSSFKKAICCRSFLSAMKNNFRVR